MRRSSRVSITVGLMIGVGLVAGCSRLGGVNGGAQADVVGERRAEQPVAEEAERRRAEEIAREAARNSALGHIADHDRVDVWRSGGHWAVVFRDVNLPCERVPMPGTCGSPPGRPSPGASPMPVASPAPRVHRDVGICVVVERGGGFGWQWSPAPVSIDDPCVGRT